MRNRQMVLLAFVSILCLILLWQSVSGVSQCEVTVVLVGRLVDGSGSPLAGQDLTFRFYVSPSKPDEEAAAATDAQGLFRLNVKVPQSSYINSGRQCVEIQGRLYVKGYTGILGYTPGSPGTVSEAGTYENWAAQGSYSGHIPLFHSLRASSGENGESEFSDMTIRMGSEENPFQITYNSSTPPAALTVNHVKEETGEAAAEAEHYIYTGTVPEHQETAPKEVDGMAPLRVEEDGKIRLEAERGSPITGYTVELQQEEQELTYYYHTDRNGDGIPDHQVTEAYLSKDGDAISGHEATTRLYANKELYRGTPPTVAGYIYKGYIKDDSELLTGTPEDVIRSDVIYKYIYEKRGSSSGGGNTPDPGGQKPEPEIPELPEEGGRGDGSGDDRDGQDGSELPEPWEPEDPEEPESVPKMPEPPVPEDNGGETQQSRSGGNTQRQEPILSEKERQELRNITFTKRSYQKQVTPGEIVTYGFTGFENSYPYPLKEFTLVDEPDRGLDLISVELTALRQGEGLTYDIVFSTNQRPESKLVSQHPANAPLFIQAPSLLEGEHITELIIQFGEVPSGFGNGDEIQMTFQVWKDPPKDDLHNLGFLYYEDQGEKVTVRSDSSASKISVEGGAQHFKDFETRVSMQRESSLIHGGNKSLSKAFTVLLWILILMGIWIILAVIRRRKRKT